MKSIYKISSVVLLSLVLFIYACEHEQGTGPQGGALQPTFSSIQDNIFTPKCVNGGCHNPTPGPMSLQAGVAFGNLVDVQSSVYGRPRVDAGDPNNSVLYLKVISNGGVGTRMPLTGSKLTSEETEAIRDWITNGAQNN